MMLYDIIIYCTSVVHVHVKKTICQLRRPVVALAVTAHVVVGFRTIAFVYQMECLAVVPVLDRTRHFRLTLFTLPIGTSLLPNKASALFQNCWRMKV